MAKTVKTDRINIQSVATLSGLFQERVKRSAHQVAYQEYNSHQKIWQGYTWEQTAREAARWQMAFFQEGLQAGDRIAIMVANSWHWVVFDQAALASGLVTVPLYTNDRPGNVAHIIQDAGVKLLLIENLAQWHKLSLALKGLNGLERIVTLQPCPDADHIKLTDLKNWLPTGQFPLENTLAKPDTLATIMYTSGTTGRPKGVMLSHHNILWNAGSVAQQAVVYTDDHLLSFLPLSHALERTAGYYLAILAGAKTSYCRSLADLTEDLQTLKPSLLVAVPRIFERAYARITEQLQQKSALAQKLFALTETMGYQRFQYQQGRGCFRWSYLLWPLLDAVVARKIRHRLGGNLRVAACGGAPLSPVIAERFLSLGITIIQGYGLTETSPIVSVNTIRDNEPMSVGRPLPDVKIRIGEQDELLVKSPGVMQGYWNNPQATAAMIDADGWLHTGDKAETLEGRIYIIGRIKEIIVLANGEKIPPQDMELAICQDPLFDQCLLIGEGLPFLSCLLVLNPEQWSQFATSLKLDPAQDSTLLNPKLLEAVLVRIGLQIKAFPGYAQVRRVALIHTPWTVDNELLTPTLKLRREPILQQHQALIEPLYAGH